MLTQRVFIDEFKCMNDRLKEYIRFAAILVGLFFGVYLLDFMGRSKTNFDDAALGKETKSFYYKDSLGNTLHFMPKTDLDTFLAALSTYETMDKVLFLGNSQSHSINQLEEGDNTMSGYLFNRMIKDSIAFVSSSAPNANLQEQYLLFSLMAEKLQGIQLLVLPIFMDDLREIGIREAYFKQFNDFNIPGQNDLAIEINSKLKSFNASTSSSNSTSNFKADNKALENTVQEKVEEKLNNILSENVDFWDSRKEVRGKSFMFLYKLRNTVLRISAQTKRKMIPLRYRKNFKALELILQQANARNINVLLMIPPIRQDVETPYIDKEYDAFKKQVNELAVGNSVNVLDVDQLVAGEFWGHTDPIQLFSDRGYDFMHFQAEGHRILADTLEQYILKHYEL